MKKFFVVFIILFSANTCAASKPPYDVIIVGLGAMGSAATYQLAKSGVTVLAIDAHNPPHTLGSTHGDTRITRLAIAEGAEYVPLVLRSQQIWREIELETGYKLLIECGGLIMSVPNKQEKHGVSNFLQQTIKTADQFDIEHTELSAAEIHSRYPQFNLVGNEYGYYENQAGYLRPEECVRAQIELAKKYGATINSNERVLSFTANDSGVTVVTNKSTYKANKMILTAGPWINDLLPEYETIFKIYRQVQYWFALKDKSQYDAYNKLPVFIWSYGEKSDDFIYGFPAIDGPNGGLKIASESYVNETTPETVLREVSKAEISAMYKKIEVRIPGLSQDCIKAIVCLYTVTPDNKFVIDFLPKHKNVIVASPCSGHGFKHSAAIGEILMQLATQGKSKIDISSFALNRFQNNS